MPPPSATATWRQRERNGAPTVGAAEAIEVARCLFTSVGLGEYPSLLLASLRKLAPFDIYSVTVFTPNAKPIMLDGNLEDFVPRRIIDNFLSGTYLLDAVFTACCSGVPPGLYRLSELAPDNYFSSDFYNSADFHPCVSDQAGSLAEEIVYMARPSGDIYLVLSLMRGNARSAFTDTEVNNLELVGPVVLTTLADHWRALIPQDIPCTTERATSRLDEAINSFANGKLSPREQTIVSLLLRGHSTLSVAYTLAIAEGTAKVHRRNIYDKLGISSQAQLFLMFCSHIISIWG